LQLALEKRGDLELSFVLSFTGTTVAKATIDLQKLVNVSYYVLTFFLEEIDLWMSPFDRTIVEHVLVLASNRDPSL
jgi:hypothetical protein